MPQIFSRCGNLCLRSAAAFRLLPPDPFPVREKQFNPICSSRKTDFPTSRLVRPFGTGTQGGSCDSSPEYKRPVKEPVEEQGTKAEMVEEPPVEHELTEDEEKLNELFADYVDRMGDQRDKGWKT